MDENGVQQRRSTFHRVPAATRLGSSRPCAISAESAVDPVNAASAAIAVSGVVCAKCAISAVSQDGIPLSALFALFAQGMSTQGRSCFPDRRFSRSLWRTGQFGGLTTNQPVDAGALLTGWKWRTAGA